MGEALVEGMEIQTDGRAIGHVQGIGKNCLDLQPCCPARAIGRTAASEGEEAAADRAAERGHGLLRRVIPTALEVPAVTGHEAIHSHSC